MIVDPEIGAMLNRRYRSLLSRLHDFVTALVPQLKTQQAREALIQLDADVMNIAHAVDTVLSDQEALTHLHLISLMVHLEDYFSLRGLWEIKLRWTLDLLETSAHVAPHLTHILFNIIGTAYSEMGNYDKAIELYSLAIRYADLAEQPDLTRVYANLGVAQWRSGHLEEALITMRRVWQTEKQAGHDYETALALANLAEIHLELGDHEGGMLAAFDALKLAQEMGNPVLQAEFAALNAKHLMANGLLHEAVPVYQMAVRLLGDLEDVPALGLALLNFGLLQRLLNNQAEAVRLVQASLALFERYGMADEIGSARMLLDQLAAG